MTIQSRPGPEVTAKMYQVSTASLPGSLAASFVASSRDAFTDKYLLDAAAAGRDKAHLARTVERFQRHLVAQQRHGMSRTDAQAAYLNASLLVASPEQFKRLLAAASPPRAAA